LIISGLIFPNGTFPGWEINAYGTLGGVQTDWEKQKYLDANLAHCPSQAKPKFYLREDTCAKRKSTSLCLLAILAFERIAGL
jgi:hypothetical protein